MSTLAAAQAVCVELTGIFLCGGGEKSIPSTWLVVFKSAAVFGALYLLLSSAGVCTNNKALEIAPSVGRRPSQGVYRTLWPFSTFPCVPTHNTIGGRRRWSHGRWILLDIYIRMSSLQYSALSAFGETIRVPMACFFLK